MAKKGFNTAATEGASVLDRLTSGAQHTQDAKDVKDVQDVKDVKDVNKEGVEVSRFSIDQLK